MNVIGRYICNNIGILFKYLFQKIKQGVFYVISLISMILKAPLMLRQLFFPANQNDIQEQQHNRQVGQVRPDVRRLSLRAIAIVRRDLDRYIRENIPSYLTDIFVVSWQLVLAICFLILLREISLLPLSLKEYDNRKYEHKY